MDAPTSAGVLYPGGRHRAQRLAAYDLLGQRVRGVDEVTSAELLEAAEAALAALAVGHGHLFRRYRRAFLQREGRPATAQEVVGSAVRVIGFDLQKAALRRTSDSRLLAWAARAYVARTSGRRMPAED